MGRRGLLCESVCGSARGIVAQLGVKTWLGVEAGGLCKRQCVCEVAAWLSASCESVWVVHGLIAHANCECVRNAVRILLSARPCLTGFLFYFFFFLPAYCIHSYVPSHCSYVQCSHFAYVLMLTYACKHFHVPNVSCFIECLFLVPAFDSLCFHLLFAYGSHFPFFILSIVHMFSLFFTIMLCVLIPVSIIVFSFLRRFAYWLF